MTSNPTELRAREFFLPGPGHYGVALLLLVTSMFLVMAFPTGTALDAAALVIQMFALIACLRAAETSPTLIRVFEILAVLAVIAGLSPALWGAGIEKDLIRGATFLLVFTALPSIAIGLLRQLKRDQEVTIRTVFGALGIYMLLIIAFASAFGIIGVVESGPVFEQGSTKDDYGSFVYYSVTTITTLGIGDLTPATDLGRSLTGLLTLIGQIYLVTVVALIVGNLGRRARERHSGPGKNEEKAGE